MDLPKFILGFATLAEILGEDIVGQPIENERHNPENGDGLQMTTKGLMVWRKADNWTAFTDGYRTCINGPYGLQERLNTEFFDWEIRPRFEVRDVIDELPQAAWNPVSTRRLAGIRWIVVHWDGGARIPEGYDPLEYYKREAYYHIQKDWNWAEPGIQGGWSLMYHEKIDRSGNVWITRPAEHVCWAAMNANYTGYMLCVDSTDGQPATRPQLATLSSRLEALRERFGLSRSAVYGHGEMTWLGNSTSCPGPELLNLVREYRQGR